MWCSPISVWWGSGTIANLTGHTYPGLYLGKKKCAWKMTLITFLKWQVDNLNLEFKKNLSRDFWKNAIWSFLLYKAVSDLKVKSVNRVPFKATDYQNASNIWFSIQHLRKKMPFVFWIFQSLHQEVWKTYFHYKTLILWWK